MAADLGDSCLGLPPGEPAQGTKEELFYRMKLASVSEPDCASNFEDVSAPKTQGSKACPVCGYNRTRESLRAPDRFHGRQEKYTLVRCPNCSLVWLNNPPEPSEMHQHYTAAYDKLISASGQNSPHRWRARKAALAPYKQSGALLDIGCSSGAFLESLQGETCRGESWKLHGIEMSAESARIAQARSGAEVFVGDVLDAPFRRESFDVITCFDVLEHLYEPRKVLSRASAWLKPGGIFYVLVPNVDCAEARVFGSYWHGLELPRHLFHYSPKSLAFLAESVGLRKVVLETHQNPAIGTSLRYVGDDMFGAVGIRRTPVASRRKAGFAWRAARKVVRMTLLRALLAVAPVIGPGGSIHAIFQKPESEKPESSSLPQDMRI
jgi:2-polyprenyl-3-methyl-5-hydroxy-6-metoxy-1,4-benzoquinol methylase